MKDLFKGTFLHQWKSLLCYMRNNNIALQKFPWYQLGDVAGRKGEPTMLIYYYFTPESVKIN